MARIRTIKPEFWESEKLGKLDLMARLSFIGLISLADDEGKGRGDPTFLRGRLHPYAPDVKIKDFSRALLRLKTLKLVEFYQIDGQSYYRLPGWHEHQKVEKPRKSSIPDEKFGEESGRSRGGLPIGMEGNGMEGNGEIRASATSPSDLLALWNKTAEGTNLPLVRELSRRRQAKCEKRLQDRPLQQWGVIFSRMAKSTFLNGENDRGWHGSLDWILANEDNAIKVLEGNYDGKPPTKSSNQLSEERKAKWKAEGKCGVCGGVPELDDDGIQRCRSCCGVVSKNGS